jgi:hypothetical protein
LKRDRRLAAQGEVAVAAFGAGQQHGFALRPLLYDLAGGRLCQLQCIFYVRDAEFRRFLQPADRGRQMLEMGITQQVFQPRGTDRRREPSRIMCAWSGRGSTELFMC